MSPAPRPHLPELAPRFASQTPESFLAHVSSLHAEPERKTGSARTKRAKLAVRITAKPKKRPVETPGTLTITLGSATTTLAFTGTPKARAVAYPALVAAALALKCEEAPLRRYLHDRYHVTVTSGASE